MSSVLNPLSDIQLFECFNFDLKGGGQLWKVKPHTKKTADKIVPLAGEPGSKERIEHYRQLVENNQSIFED